MVEVKSGANVVLKCEYDGTDRRIKAHIDTQAPAEPNGVDHYRHFFYNANCTRIHDFRDLLGRKIRWHPAAEQVLGDPEAGRMMGRSMRSPWRIC